MARKSRKKTGLSNLFLTFISIVFLFSCCSAVFGSDSEPESTEVAETTITTFATTEATIEPTTETTAATDSTTEATTEATTIPTTVPEETEPEGTLYVLNTNTRKFHHPWCSSANSIKEKNRQEITATREEVIAKGYKPCSRCKP